jgi:hypothetical protein
MKSTTVKILTRSSFFSKPVSFRKHRTASKKESLGLENNVSFTGHNSMTKRSARQNIGEARNNENGSEKRVFEYGEDWVMVLRAMATRAQSADCHDNCGREAGLDVGSLMPLFGIGEVKLKEDMLSIFSEKLYVFWKTFVRG